MFWETVKQELKRTKTTLKKMCEDLGLSYASVKNLISRGSYPDAKVIVKIAIYLRMTTDTLLGADTDCFSEEEKKLLNLYRGLSDSYKKILVETAEGFQGK